jgi:hypothetical protein
MGDMFAVGGCNCTCNPCTVGQVVALDASDSCCVCSHQGTPPSAIAFTFDAPVNGITTYHLTGFAGSTWSSSCFSDGGTGSFNLAYQPTSGYYTPQIAHSPTNATCPTGMTLCTLSGPPTTFQCNPSFSANYTVTNTNCPYLFGLGVRNCTVTGLSGGTVCNIDCVTCGAVPGIPHVLQVSDVLGNYTATWSTSLSLWVTPQLCSGNVSPIAKCTSGTGACDTASNSAGALYVYSIGCTSSGHMSLTRYWYELRCVSPLYQYSPCACSPGGPQAYSQYSTAVTCGSISASGTPVRVSGNLADPVGGAVYFNQ